MGLFCQFQERRIKKYSKKKILKRNENVKYVCLNTRHGSIIINSIYLRYLMDQSSRIRLKR